LVSKAGWGSRNLKANNRGDFGSKSICGSSQKGRLRGSEKPDHTQIEIGVHLTTPAHWPAISRPFGKTAVSPKCKTSRVCQRSLSGKSRHLTPYQKCNFLT
jgi:hypothetical protein